MAIFEKHRNEKEVYAVDFKDRLTTGETLTGTPVVKVFQYDRDNDKWDDVSSQFYQGGSLQKNLQNSTQVAFWLEEAALTTEQLGGIYTIVVDCPTTQGRTITAHPSLEVDDEGS